jgi:hypothetical protein
VACQKGVAICAILPNRIASVAWRARSAISQSRPGDRGGLPARVMLTPTFRQFHLDPDGARLRRRSGSIALAAVERKRAAAKAARAEAEAVPAVAPWCWRRARFR